MAKDRILLVEDNPMNRRVAEFLLKAQGYIVYEARDGQEAVEMLHVHSPDLILMDLQLPGLDGFATTRIIKENAATKHIPVVALTAYAMRGDAERALRAGCDGYITKPIDPDAFPATVASYLKGRGAEADPTAAANADASVGAVTSEDMRATTQEVRIRKARVETIGSVATVLSHESRNLLGALGTCVQVLRRNPRLSEQDTELLDLIDAGSRRLNEMVSQFSAFAHPQPLQVQELDLKELVKETCERLQGDPRCASSIVIRCQFDSSVSSLKADRNRLAQVLWNLCLNAVEAMGERGQLEIETRSLVDRVSIAVRDDGPGIPANVLPEIFEPLYTTKPKGAGLGLAIARSMVEEHGGQLGVKSDDGGGASFTVVLPLDSKPNLGDDSTKNTERNDS